ncbi:MAG: four helix bundle protein [Bacillati bacterium ANGP1]|uniref:Four helix bundle protein n=1 Tax=Candidatus Segetimicrobium genomatis TaxID=2569760 RepID=A0A537LSF1_9BACT|nr:MAG: four helix bundle protein [Terrabacteria group bacterium ANGP1]
MTPERYKELDVWKKAYDLALRVYRVTETFPSEERFGLTQQLRRAAVAVFANIAEGHARGTRKDYAQFCVVARASQAEARALLSFARDLVLLEEAEWQELDADYAQVGRMLNGLVTALRREFA